MRDLLAFETEILLEAGVPRDDRFLRTIQVTKEYYANKKSHQKIWFNTDFYIELDTKVKGVESKATCIPIRPESLGAEFFVSLTENRVPTMLELLDGESIPISSFQQEIERLDQVFNTLPELPRRSSVKSYPYLRIAALTKGVAFVVSSTTNIGDLFSIQAVQIQRYPHQIEYRNIKEEFLLDGIICTTSDPYRHTRNA